MPSRQLYNKLNQQGYLCAPAFAAQVASALITRPVAGAFLRGMPGTGKTYLPEQLARANSEELFFEQCFPGCRDDLFKIKYEPCEETVSGMRGIEGVLVLAARATLAGRRAVLCIDELDKAQPSVDAFWLDFLQTGRISAGSVRLTADLSLLTVFFTLNDERDISLPLLRRLPVIEFAPLPLEQVAAALELSHGDSPLIEPACILYARTLQAGLEKPATIQELRQLMDAIDHLGEAADWDTLVRQFVTKGDEAHGQLRAVEKTPIKLPKISQSGRLSTAAYTGDQLGSVALVKQLHPSLPRLGARTDVTALPIPAEHSAIYGIIPWSTAAYSHLLAHATFTLRQQTGSGANIGTLASVVGDEQGKAIVINEPQSFDTPDCLAPFAALTSGEISFSLAGVTHDNIKNIWDAVRKKDGSKLEFSSFGDDGAQACYGGHVSISWQPEAGLTVVADLEHQEAFVDFAKLWDKAVMFESTRLKKKKEEAAEKKQQAAEIKRLKREQDVEEYWDANEDPELLRAMQDYVCDIYNDRHIGDRERADLLADFAWRQMNRQQRNKRGWA